MPPEPPTRHRQSSSDGDRPSIEVDKSVGVAAGEQRRFDEPKRRTTLTNLQAAKPTPRKETLTGFPADPKTPIEYSPTQRAPSTTTATVRIPHDETRATGSLPPPSLSPEAAAIDALRRRAEAAETRRDELERRERVRAEAQSPAGWPPKVDRSQSPAPRSIPAKVDEVIGKGVRHLLAKLWPFFVAAAGIGGGVTAVAKPSADPAKADAALVKLDELQREVSLLHTQLNSALDREAASSAYVECLAEQQAEYFAQLSPAPDRMGAAAQLRPFVDRCKSRKP